METEFEKSKPNGKGERPLAVARRSPGESGDVNSDVAEAIGHSSGDVTVYSAQSSIRNPVQLIQNIY